MAGLGCEMIFPGGLICSFTTADVPNFFQMNGPYFGVLFRCDNFLKNVKGYDM